MSLLLSIETSTSVCTVAIHKDNSLVAERSIDSDKSHSKLLLQFIEDLLTENNHTLQEIAALAISEGPGSYTGLRIGLSTAKGLCYSLDIPLIAINTLDALGLQISKTLPDTELACPMIDARRMEVYCTILNNTNKRVKALNNEIIDENSFAEYLNNNIIHFFGDGAEKCKDVITHDNANYIEDVKPSASTVGELGLIKLANKDFEDVAYFEPNYFKEFYTPPAKNKTLLNLVKKS